MASTKDEAMNFVSDRIEEAVSYSANAYRLFEEFMGDLATASSSLLEYGEVTAGIGSPDTYLVDPFLGTAPEWESPEPVDVQMPSLTPFFTIPALGDITMPDPMTLEDAPNPEVLFFERDYISNVLESLNNKLLGDLVGGTGLAPEVEQAIYDRDAVRRADESAKQLDEINYQFVGRGFDVPQGALTSALQQASNARVVALNDHSRDVMIQAANMEQENAKVAKQYAVQIESVLIDAHGKVQDRALKAEELRLTSEVEIWKASWERYRGLMEVAKLEADIELGKLQATTSANSAIAQMNIAEIEAAKAEIDLEISRIDVEVKAFSASVDGFSAAIKAYEVEEGASVRGFEASVKYVEAEAALQVKAAEANIQAIIAVRSLLLEASKGGANVSAQALASALNSVNAAVSFGHHGSYNVSETNSYDKTKRQESGATTQNIHTFDETKA